MDRKFMKEFYRRYYDMASEAAIKDSEEYKQKSERRSEIEAELIDLLGGTHTSEYHKFDEFLTAMYEEFDVMLEETYLMGAADREKMLK